MATNCTTGMAPPSAIFIKNMEPEYVGLAATCGVLTLGVMVVFMEEFYYLYQHLDSWRSRFHVTFLLSVYPIYSLLSMVTLFIPRSIPINDMVSGIYISVCLYVFVRLLIGHFNGKEAMMNQLIGQDMKLAVPPVCCCFFCLPVIKISRCNVHLLEGIVLQYGIIRTVFGYLSAVGYSDKQDSFDITTVFSRGIFLIMSTLLAMYGLQLLYRISVKPLEHIPLTPKFRCLQLVLIIDNVQSSIFTSLGSAALIPCANGLSHEINSYRIHRMLTTLEILIISLIARKYYKKHMEDIRLGMTSHGFNRYNSTRSTTQIIPPERSGSFSSVPDGTLSTEDTIGLPNDRGEGTHQSLDIGQVELANNTDDIHHSDNREAVEEPAHSPNKNPLE